MSQPPAPRVENASPRPASSAKTPAARPAAASTIQRRNGNAGKRNAAAIRPSETDASRRGAAQAITGRLKTMIVPQKSRTCRMRVPESA